MTFTATLFIVHLVGAIALLLFGIRQVKHGMTRAYGVTLRSMIDRSSKSRIKGFATGLVITALLQSSTATSLLITSFASKRLLSIAGALSIALGADVGTTLIAQLLSFKMDWIGPLLMTMGVIGFSRFKTGRPHYVSWAIIGLGLLLISVSQMVEATAPLKNATIFKDVLAATTSDPIMVLLLSIGMAWLMHSSLAMVLFVMSLAGAGIIDLDIALLCVLGANIGGYIPPILINLREGGMGRIVAVGTFSMKVVGALTTAIFLIIFSPPLDILGDRPERAVVNFHMWYNLVRGLCFLPFTGIIAQLITALSPKIMSEQNTFAGEAEYLDKNLFELPSAALSAAQREILRLSDLVHTMLEKSVDLFHGENRSLIDTIRENDEAVDHLHHQIKDFLTQLSRTQLEKNHSEQCLFYLMITVMFEHMGDTIEKDIVSLGNKRLLNNLKLSQSGIDEVTSIHQHVMTSFRLCVNLFLRPENSQAKHMITRTQELRKMIQKSSVAHFGRVREQNRDAELTSGMHLEVIQAYQRLNDMMMEMAHDILQRPDETAKT